MSDTPDTPLRRVRKAAGKSIQDVANDLKLDQGNLSRIERGTQIPHKDTAERLAQYFDGAISEMEIIYPERYTPSSAA